jgi:uncharacterized membrane protein YjjP (DUF1212 family)
LIEPPSTTTDGRAAVTRDELREVLVIAMRAGQIMLENGANTARVEETIARIGAALGGERADVYATPSGIIATFAAGAEHRTRVQRSTRAGIDLSRVAAVLEISRAAEAGALGLAGVREALERVATQGRVYGPSTTTLAVALACACTGALFGGGALEFAVVLVAAGAAHLLRGWMQERGLGRLLVTGLVAGFATALALALATLAGAQRPGPALLGAVILLVPGVLMVSSVADLFRGDVLSGSARAVSALLVLIAIAGGVWAALLITGAQVSLSPAPVVLPFAPLLALLSAGGFGVMFDVPRRALLACALVGAASYAVYDLCLLAGAPPGAAAFVAGGAVGLLSLLLARWLRQPTMLFSIPGFIPLVPGALAFRTLIEFVSDDYTAGTANMVRAAVITIALAAGLGTASALARRR